MFLRSNRSVKFPKNTLTVFRFTTKIDKSFSMKKSFKRAENRNFIKRIKKYQKETQILLNDLRAKTKSPLKNHIFNMIARIATSLAIIFFLGKFIRNLQERNLTDSEKNSNYEEIPPKIDDAISDEQYCKDGKKVDFSSVCGNQEAKEQLMDIVEFLKNPEKFQKVKAKVPKGVLLSGPPGCGKTLMARAMSGEANVTFLSTTGSAFDELFKGSGAARVRNLFKNARKKAPCIIFIDELDSVGESRKSFGNVSRMTLNQLLSEIDGFNENDNIIVIGATNLPKRLDSALTRSGRFDRFVEVQLPDSRTREHLLEINLKNKSIASDVNLTELANKTTGLNGADMVNLVNIAAIATLKNRENEITQERLRDAVLQVSIGKVNKSIHPSQKVINNTAVHEAGHTVVALFTPGAKKVDLLTILPRGPSLGSTWLTPKEGAQYLQSYEEMLGQLDVMMGGHAAEELVFGRENATSGASSDFKNATNLAVAMVAQFGMSDSLGKFSSDPGQFSQWSPYLKEQVLTEARKLTDDSYCRAFNEVSRKDTLLQDEIYEIAQIR